MGSNKHFYMGIYLEVPIITKPITETYRVKSNGKRAKSKFNPETGLEYESKTVTKMEKYVPSAYIEDHDTLQEDMFFDSDIQHNNSIIFLHNGNLDYDDDVDVVKSLIDLNVESKIFEFTLKYHNYITYYTEKFGGCKVNYGVVQYWR